MASHMPHPGNTRRDRTRCAISGKRCLLFGRRLSSFGPENPSAGLLYVRGVGCAAICGAVFKSSVMQTADAPTKRSRADSPESAEGACTSEFDRNPRLISV